MILHIYEDFNIHSLRHTFSSNLRAQNYPEHIIQELMGHKSPTETKTYMHLTEDEFNTTMMRFTKSESTDFLSSLLSATNLSADKINAIKNIINN
ncbi:MAG: tyrosine-type recombinase/integrase [Clostridia bacterium]|nr:tyrosine-type recombinase/integrase [Clostridia bacterium]